MRMGECAALLAAEPMLGLAIAAILLAGLGWMMERGARPAMGRNLRHAGYLGLGAALLLTIVLGAWRADRSDAAMLLAQNRQATVSGGEIHIAMRPDGHFWLDGAVNGVTVPFLVDTGASYTGLSAANARRAGIVPDPGQMPVDLETANGQIVARLGTIRALQLGGIAVRNLPAVIAPNEDDTNVIGMNLLSRLASWRVEGRVLVLVPR